MLTRSLINVRRGANTVSSNIRLAIKINEQREEVVLTLILAKMSGSNPTDDNADDQYHEDHQRPGHGNFPEQQLNLHDGSILHDENHGKQ